MEKPFDIDENKRAILSMKVDNYPHCGGFLNGRVGSPQTISADHQSG